MVRLLLVRTGWRMVLMVIKTGVECTYISVFVFLNATNFSCVLYK